MTNTELRIGNWIAYHGIPVKVSMVGLVTIDIFGPYLDPDRASLTPIPLTPEILVKCGFVKTTSVIGEGSFAIDYVDYRLGNMVATVIDAGIEIDFAPEFDTIEDRNYVAIVHHLHTLQNLFYSLTGTELNYTP